MADTATKKPLWITLGAAVATVIVILGIAAGPSALTCVGSEDGFGACMRDRLADFGILKQGPAPVSAPVEQVSDAQETAEPEVTEPMVGTEAAEPAAPMIEPRLGLVRAEPDGSLVIAGSAAPGAEVEVYVNGRVLGRVTAESSGDWVLIPDSPLPAGGVEISVGVPAAGQMAAQSVVVVIQDDLKTEPLVVASTPGQASAILQGLSVPVEEEMEVAEAEAAATPAEEAAATPAEESVEMASAAAGADAADAGDDAADAEEIIAVAVADMPGAAALATAPQAGEAGLPEANEETFEVAKAEPVTEPVVEPETSVAVVPPSIDAIEVDGALNFFAGGGTEGATVRLYVDGQYVADSTVQDGRWLVETQQNYLTSPSQRVRVDMLRPGTAEVMSRAEVNFELALPEPEAESEAEQPVAVAAAPEPAIETEATDVAAMINQAASDNAASLLADAPQVGTAAPEAVAVAPQVAEPAEEPAPAMAEEEPATEQETDVATAMATEEETAPAEEEVPTLTAVQVGDPEDQRFASGRAIIRRGDNLWAIASRVYGSGYRYITIYRANKDQIRDPDLIYPGQVFDLPEESE